MFNYVTIKKSYVLIICIYLSYVCSRVSNFTNSSALVRQFEFLPRIENNFTNFQLYELYKIKMDTFLLVAGFLLTIIGIVGAFLPVLPGPPIGWAGLLLLHLTDIVPMDKSFLGITLAVAILVTVLDYVIPALGTKKFGGTKYGIWGTTIGLIVGLILPIPFGFLIGAFAGAYIGEMMNEKDSKKALRAAYGSFIGFLGSTFLKFVVGVIFIWNFISIVSDHSEAFFQFTDVFSK